VDAFSTLTSTSFDRTIVLDIEGPGGFVYKDKLYVCGNDAAGKIFKSEIKSNIAKADANWPKLIGSQSQKR
jgi:hypothetical protein